MSTAIEDGTFFEDATLDLMAERGYFDPNVPPLHNHPDNRGRFNFAPAALVYARKRARSNGGCAAARTGA